MQNRTTSILIALALSTLMFPSGASEETEEEEYRSALGAREGVTGQEIGLGIMFFTDPKVCDHCSMVSPLGGVYLRPDIPYDHVDLSVVDAAFEQTASQVCFLNPDGDNLCDDDDHNMGAGCGARSIRDVPVVASMVQVYLYSVYIAPSLDVCMTSTGTVRATFY